MTTGGPERPAYESSSGGVEFPPLEDTGLPPPIYAPPPPGYPGTVPYYPMYDPYRPVRPPGTNGTAVASLVTSIAGWLCCAPLAIVGLIMGVIAMRETKRTGQEGWGLALAGTIIGGVFVALALVVVFIYIALGVSTLQ